jgi:uncharacterized membrane protein YcaP (DUF421 family)
MFFDGVSDLWRIAIGISTYALLVAVLRLSGKRTLAKMNAFDLVVTVALGSSMATILLSRDVALSEGVLALGLLVVLQFAATRASVHWSAARRLLKSDPTLLLRDGELLSEALRQQRVTASEVRQAVRAHAIGGLEQVTAVVLETDGTFSVIPRQQAGSRSALKDARGATAEAPTRAD